MAARLDRNDPGCYHSMLRYLSEKTGISMFKEIIVKKVWKQSPHTGKKKLVYNSRNIIVVDKGGKRHAYMHDQKRYDLRGIEADHFAVSVMRDSEEFGVKVNSAGNYRDSLGGGWYSNCAMFEIDGKFFAAMECACGHNGYLVNPAAKEQLTNTMNTFDPKTDEVKDEQATERDALATSEQGEGEGDAAEGMGALAD